MKFVTPDPSATREYQSIYDIDKATGKPFDHVTTFRLGLIDQKPRIGAGAISGAFHPSGLSVGSDPGSTPAIWVKCQGRAREHSTHLG